MTDILTRNGDALRTVADAIETEQVIYNQGVWGAVPTDGDYEPQVGISCGTACCLAGTAVLTAGGRFVVEREAWRLSRIIEDYTLHVGFCVTAKGDEVLTVEEYGRKVLGLTETESRQLFAGDWAPDEGLTVPEALRKLAEGASLSSVSVWEYDWLDEMPVEVH